MLHCCLYYVPQVCSVRFKNLPTAPFTGIYFQVCEHTTEKCNRSKTLRGKKVFKHHSFQLHREESNLHRRDHTSGSKSLAVNLCPGAVAVLHITVQTPVCFSLTAEGNDVGVWDVL